MKTINLLKKLPAFLLAVIFVSVSLVSCQKDSSDNMAATTFKITDAPIDDAAVTGAFVTIADIQLDGQSVKGFSKTTIDVYAYQNGATKTIGTFNLAGRTYNTVTFVLDYNLDANGVAPGCYIMTSGSVKHKLESASNVVTVTKTISLSGNTSIVADFDLRKMIVRQTGGGADQYNFATSAELQAAIRVVAENNTGKITGTLNNTVAGTGKIIAYAYKKGTYNRTTEMQEQGSGNIRFKNAVSSASVAGTGNFQLSFLESGEYEVHFANYSNNNGQWELTGTLVVTGNAGVDLLGLNLTAAGAISANATATAILP